MHARAYLEAARRRHAHRRLVVARHQRQAPGREHAGAVGGLLAVAREADPDQPSVGSALALALAPGIEADLDAHHQERLAIVAAVVVLLRDVVVGHGLGGDEIVVPDLPGLAPDLARDRIHHQLHGEANAGARDPAI